jgi:alpha-galactosidase
MWRLRAGGVWFDGSTPMRLVRYSTTGVEPEGLRLAIVLEDMAGLGRFELNLELYAGHPVLRYHTRFTNLRGISVQANAVNMVPWAFADGGRRYRAFRVNQWVTDFLSSDFLPLDTALDPAGKAVEAYSGAHGSHFSWLVLRDDGESGLFFGWEFDGRARTSVRHYGAEGYLQLASNILEMNHPVEAGAVFETPAAFIGLFNGDWDEAGYRTQRFSEAVLAMKPPDADNFPFVGWDSWAYGQNIDEATLRRTAEVAAKIGVELFTVDLGWARSIGDWHADDAKFPGGLRALSGYVHSLGMKFGLHFALAEAAPGSPVLAENPDWTSSESYHYYGAESLCLSNRPAREWLIKETLRIIDEYDPDWILQDGENMVKRCTKTTHTHHPGDSNYSNAVEGLNAVLAEVQRQRPKVYWENCENGGNMMTFNMVRRYVTSITNDASGSLSSRRAVYGVTFPFPPRYADRYMPEQEANDYVTNSYKFGGPWVMMNRLLEMKPEQLAFLASEVAKFKARRKQVAEGKVFHLAAPGETRIDAIQSYDAASDSALAVVTRAQASAKTYTLRPRGLDPGRHYMITFESDPRALTMNGEQLMRDGVRVNLPEPMSSEVVFVDPRP